MIRTFQSADAGQVMKLWLSGNIDAHPFIPKEYWESNFALVQEQLLQAEVYVYEHGGSIQGFIGLQEDYIAGIFVKEDCRGTGIGKKLLDHVKVSHSVLTLNVYQKNFRAVEFYKRESFDLISEDIEPDSGEMDETMHWHHRNKGEKDIYLCREL